MKVKNLIRKRKRIVVGKLPLITVIQYLFNKINHLDQDLVHKNNLNLKRNIVDNREAKKKVKINKMVKEDIDLNQIK